MSLKSDLASARPPGWSRQISPFHAGEQEAQERTGVRARMEEVGRRVIREAMPDQHRDLFKELPTLIVGSLDGAGRPWASILFGRPGFIVSPDPRRLEVSARPISGDPFGENLSKGRPIGALGLQFETRRRNRMNGTVTRVDDHGFSIEVGQSFGNCAKYIQRRDWRFAADPSETANPHPIQQEARLLSPTASRLIERADTFFIATAASGAHRGHDAIENVDISHRGGKPGFVRMAKENDGTVLIAPDFLGNFFFNTLGNVLANPAAGLLFLDFETGDLLWLTGRAEVIWAEGGAQVYPGAQRFLRFSVEEGRLAPGLSPLCWSAPEYAPHLATVGPWPSRG